LIYDLCIFKGGESPVNYSFGRWQIEGLKEGANVAKHLGMHRQQHAMERKLESGEIHDDPKI
jgi:aquaglyceroporin related protein